MDYAAKCKDYIKANNVVAEQRAFRGKVRTAQEAAELLGVKLEQIVKTVIVFVGRKEGPSFISCILCGADKVDFGKIRQINGTGNVRIATKDEVLAATGYPVGGVPPFGYDLPFYIDTKVMALESFYAGGGSDETLVTMTPQELEKVTKGTITAIAQ